MIRIFFALFFMMLFSLQACLQSSQQRSPSQAHVMPWFVNEKGDTIQRVVKSDEIWRSELDPMAFYVLREKGTERAFSGKYNDNKKSGTYTCNACGLDLFSSTAKFDSGTGWPSFYEPIDPTHILEESDNALGMRRVEVLCKRCGGHLGHVFDDGPKPTGLRYCMNSVSLEFKERK